MTIETAPAQVLDLAMELYFAGDAESLTHALAIAEDLDRTLGALAIEWDAAVGAAALQANDFDTAFAALPF